MHNLALAEDVVQDAFCRALEVWKFSGVPANPSAWLMATAKNRALDILRRERTARNYAPELGHLLQTEWTLSPTIDELFKSQTIADDQLRMMFTCCNPLLPESSQIALTLRVICGFSVEEAASAFLISQDAMEKRITRAKKVLAGSRTLFDLKDSDLCNRQSAVLRSLYLLFNEGYHATSSEIVVRKDICLEAMRLTSLLLHNPTTSTPATCALYALMHLLAARIPARMDEDGHIVVLKSQDRTQWSSELIAEGKRLLDLSAEGTELSEYHIEAAIAAVHADAPSAAETDWEMIISLYDSLMALAPSPVIALNRAIAVAQLEGPLCGISAVEEIADRDRLLHYPFYHAAVGEMRLLAGNCATAMHCFNEAQLYSRNAAEKAFFKQRAEVCRIIEMEKSDGCMPACQGE